MSSTLHGDDEWERVFDEQFVAGGRHEPTAAERIARAGRSAVGAARLAPVDLAPVSRPRRRSGGLAAVLVLLLVLALGAAAWGAARPGEPLGQPAAAPSGSGGYAFLDQQPVTGRPVTFDPCRPIHYVVRPDGSPPSGPAMLAAALAEVSRATGLVFVDDGPTTEAPSLNRHERGRWALRSTPPPVLIAWSTAEEWAGLAGRTAGEAGPVQESYAGGPARYVSGQVVLDAEDLAHAPGDRRAAEEVRLVLLHELGHLVGLAHVVDSGQVMHASATGLGAYGAGDLRGLHELGSGRCS